MKRQHTMASAFLGAAALFSANALLTHCKPAPPPVARVVQVGFNDQKKRNAAWMEKDTLILTLDTATGISDSNNYFQDTLLVASDLYQHLDGEVFQQARMTDLSIKHPHAPLIETHQRLYEFNDYAQFELLKEHLKKNNILRGQNSSNLYLQPVRH